MVSLLSYLVESTICSVVLFLFYRLMLSHITFFQWRRVFLLIGVAFCVVVPVLNIEVSIAETNKLMQYPLDMMVEIKGNMGKDIFSEDTPLSTTEGGLFDLQRGWNVVMGLYIIIASFLLVKFLSKLFFITRYRKNGEVKNSKGYSIVESERVNIPFSFLNTIYFPKGQLYNARDHNFILEHEKVHVFQKHSLDILFISVIRIVFWFNPIYVLIMKEMRMVHEFIADDHVSSTSNHPVSYARLILKLASAGKNFTLVNNFSKLQIKERIIMLKKEKTPPFGKTRFLFIIPLCLILIAAFSVKQKQAPNKSSKGIADILVSNGLLPGLIIDQNTKPSGFPLDNRFHRVSSGFGMRKHPVDKALKMHRGIDFPAPTGTPVYTTADGVVTMVKDAPDGYGKHIRIKHGEYETLYAQLSSFEVKVGDKVQRGQIIGKVGNSGVSTGPHLHYEVIKNGEAVDPKKTFC